jgi:HSP20 family molecular chaperone IbpA
MDVKPVKNAIVTQQREPAAPRSTLTPRAELTTSDEGATIRFQVPGASADSVDVTLEEDRLTVSARVDDSLPEGYEWTYRERPSGDFKTTVLVPFDVAEDGVAATVDNGVLTVQLKRSAPVKRKITVSAG